MTNFLRKHLSAQYRPLPYFYKVIIYKDSSYYINIFKNIREQLILNKHVFYHDIGLCTLARQAITDLYEQGIFPINRDINKVSLVLNIIYAYAPLNFYVILFSDLYFYPPITKSSTIHSPEVLKRIKLVNKIIKDITNKNL